jgi:xylulokinase
MSWCARAALARHRVACKRPLTQKPAWHRTGFRCSRTVPAVSHDVSQCVLAVDIGTTSLKAILLAPDGTALRVSTRGYKRGTHAGTTGCSGAMEQDPEDWVGAFCEAARDVFEPFADDASPAGVALSGQMQNIVLVRGGKSLRPALLYSDVRAVGEADEIRERLGKNDARGGSIDIDAKLANFKGAAAVLSKWKWLAKHDSALLKKSESMLLGAHSCLAYVLCGGAKDAAQCDVTTASTTGLLRPDDFGDGDDSARWALGACCVAPFPIPNTLFQAPL